MNVWDSQSSQPLELSQPMARGTKRSYSTMAQAPAVSKRKTYKAKKYRYSKYKQYGSTYKPVPIKTLPEMKEKHLQKESESVQITGNVLSPVTLPFRIDQGTDKGNRIGCKITERGVAIKGAFTNREGQPAMWVRMVVIKDKYQNQTVFTGDQFLYKSGNSVSHDQGPESAWLPINTNRYHVYSDKLIKLGSSGNEAENVKMFNTYIPLRQTATYSGSGSTSMLTNNVQIAYWAINPTSQSTISANIVGNYSVVGYFQDS